MVIFAFVSKKFTVLLVDAAGPLKMPATDNFDIFGCQIGCDDTKEPCISKHFFWFVFCSLLLFISHERKEH
jgi:hypothetical protein